MPSLARWPRCNGLSVDFDAGDMEARTIVPALLRLVTGVSVEQRRNVARLRLSCETAEGREWAAEATAWILFELPALQEVELDGLTGMIYHERALQFMHEALGALPHLELLTLPGCKALEHLGSLATGPGANSLRRLEVHGDPQQPTHLLQPRMLTGLHRLPGLRHLLLLDCVLGDTPQLTSPTLRYLLANAPPSLERLDLRRCWHPHHDSLDMTVHLRAGHIEALELATEGASPSDRSSAVRSSVELGALAYLAQDVLLPCLGPTRGLRRLEVGMLSIRRHDPLSEAATEALRALRRRCGTVGLRAMQLDLFLRGGGVVTPLDAGLQLAAGELALELFGQPERVGLQMWCRLPRIETVITIHDVVWMRVSAPALPAAEASPRQQDVAPAPCVPAAGAATTSDGATASADGDERGSSEERPALPPVVSAGAVLRDALRRMEEGQGPGAAVAAPDDGDDAGASEQLGMVLLRGPIVAMLVQTPFLLEKWLNWLAGRVMKILADETPGAHFYFRASQLLPSAGAVLVVCDATARHAVVAAAAGAAGTAAEAGGAAEAAPPLEARPMPRCWRNDGYPMLALPVQRMVFAAVQEALQGAWDEAVARGGGGAVGGSVTRAVLEWALSMQAQLLEGVPAMEIVWELS